MQKESVDLRFWAIYVYAIPSLMAVNKNVTCRVYIDYSSVRVVVFELCVTIPRAS